MVGALLLNIEWCRTEKAALVYGSPYGAAVLSFLEPV